MALLHQPVHDLGSGGMVGRRTNDIVNGLALGSQIQISHIESPYSYF